MPRWFNAIRDRLFGSSKDETDWQYREEVIAELGPVSAVYSGGQLLWYDYVKDGVILEINCEVPGGKQAGIEVAKTITPKEIQEHLDNAVRSIPREVSEAHGLRAGKWKMEKIIINSKKFFVLELGNSGDQDHCCRVVFENDHYEFECNDG
jgi:hypothetical protein